MYQNVMNSIDVRVPHQLQPIDEFDCSTVDVPEDINYEASLDSDENDNNLDESTNAEYLAFIKETRKHQMERERSKQERLMSQPELAFEPYYTDVSQINTLVADNVVEIPERSDQLSKTQKRTQELIDLYGGQEKYEKIRSVEMEIDGYFSEKCKELSPSYWPAMPINPKPYLNERS